MPKQCVTCNEKGIYKCPTCLVYYCSVRCCKKHRELQCNITSKPENPASTSGQSIEQKFITADTISSEKLILLKDNKTLNNLLTNPHLRDILLSINKSTNPEQLMQKAMQEPLFMEFADTCLETVETKEN